MLTPHTYPALVRDRQQALLDDINARRLARDAAPTASHMREWLARRLVMLALYLAPSQRRSLRGLFVDEDGATLLHGQLVGQPPVDPARMP